MIDRLLKRGVILCVTRYFVTSKLDVRHRGVVWELMSVRECRGGGFVMRNFVLDGRAIREFKGLMGRFVLVVDCEHGQVWEVKGGRSFGAAYRELIGRMPDFRV